MRKLILILFFLISCSSFLSAQGFATFEETFFSEVSQKDYKKYLHCTKEKDYRNIEKFFTDKNKMYSKTIIKGDPHKKESQVEQTTLIPHWVNIFNAYYDSAIKHKSPIAANSALIILRAYIGQVNAEKYIKKRLELAKILYEHEHCSGYLEYGDSLNYGLGIKVDKQTAKNIYIKGIIACQPASQWKQNMIEMRLNNLELLSL